MSVSHNQALSTYYRFHAPIYDLTRWSFLGGRSKLINRLADFNSRNNGVNVLEIGCGTGILISKLANKRVGFECHGIDLSESMLNIAKKRYSKLKTVHFHSGSILDFEPKEQFNLIYASYSLTMMKPILPKVINKISTLLGPEGQLWVVDFYKSPIRIFKNWMKMNHVDFLESQMAEFHPYFEIVESNAYQMYAGLWEYRIIRFRKKEI